jgi:hypothetical protein
MDVEDPDREYYRVALQQPVFLHSANQRAVHHGRAQVGDGGYRARLSPRLYP